MEASIAIAAGAMAPFGAAHGGILMSGRDVGRPARAFKLYRAGSNGQTGSNRRASQIVPSAFSFAISSAFMPRTSRRISLSERA